MASIINVNGVSQRFDHNLITWDITADRESGVSETSSTYYYFYITETGDKVISDKKPFDRMNDLFGFYHPHHPWRCVGWAFNNSGSDLEQIESYYHARSSEVVRSVAATDYLLPRDRVILLSGASFTEYLPAAALCKGNIYTFVHNGTSLSQVYTLDGFSTETIAGATTVKMHTNGQVLRIISDGSNWLILESKTATAWVSNGAITITATGGSLTKASSPVVDRMLWRRQGSELEGRFEYSNPNPATGSATGTGDVLFNVMPTGATIDTSLVTVYATLEGAGNFDGRNCVGSGVVTLVGTSSANSMVMVYDTSTVRLFNTGASAGAVCVTIFPITGALQGYFAEYRVPVTDWIA